MSTGVKAALLTVASIVVGAAGVVFVTAFVWWFLTWLGTMFEAPVIYGAFMVLVVGSVVFYAIYSAWKHYLLTRERKKRKTR